MKTYKMLKTVQGSHDGIKVETFRKGDTHELDAHLAEQFYHMGAVEEVEARGPNLREGSKAGGNPADGREKKVTGPSDTKVDSPAAYKGQEGEAGIDPKTQRIEELNATARDHYGLDTDTKMEPQEIREAIDGDEPDEAQDVSRMTKKQIIAHAKDNLGLELDQTAKKEELVAAVEAHTA